MGGGGAQMFGRLMSTPPAFDSVSGNRHLLRSFVSRGVALVATWVRARLTLVSGLITWNRASSALTPTAIPPALNYPRHEGARETIWLAAAFV